MLKSDLVLYFGTVAVVFALGIATVGITSPISGWVSPVNAVGIALFAGLLVGALVMGLRWTLNGLRD